MLNILLIHTDNQSAKQIQHSLSKSNLSDCHLTYCPNEAAISSSLSSGKVWHIILYDIGDTGPDSQTKFSDIFTKAGGAAIIALGNAQDEIKAMQTIAYGAEDFVVKDQLTPATLARTLRYAIERKRRDKKTLRGVDLKCGHVFYRAKESICLGNEHGVISDANMAFMEQFSYTEAEIKNLTIQRVFFQDKK